MTRTPYRHDGKAGSAYVAAVGQRIGWITAELWESQTKCAADIGTDQSTLAKWIAGSRLATIGPMLRLCDLSGVTMDYIYRGLIGGHMRRDTELRLVAKHPELIDSHPDLADRKLAQRGAQAAGSHPPSKAKARAL